MIIKIVAPSKEPHILIPRTYEYVTWHGKRDFVDVIRLRIWRWKVVLDCSGKPTVITDGEASGPEEKRDDQGRG